jgi:hypothetical protein
MANEEHLALLKQGVEAWNEWKANNPDIRPDLSFATGNGITIRGAKLSGVDLSRANLSRADLSRADLIGAKPQRGLPQRGLPQRGLPDWCRPQ